MLGALSGAISKFFRPKAAAPAVLPKPGKKDEWADDDDDDDAVTAVVTPTKSSATDQAAKTPPKSGKKAPPPVLSKSSKKIQTRVDEGAAAADDAIPAVSTTKTVVAPTKLSAADQAAKAAQEAEDTRKRLSARRSAIDDDDDDGDDKEAGIEAAKKVLALTETAAPRNAEIKAIPNANEGLFTKGTTKVYNHIKDNLSDLNSAIDMGIGTVPGSPLAVKAAKTKTKHIISLLSSKGDASIMHLWKSDKKSSSDSTNIDALEYRIDQARDGSQKQKIRFAHYQTALATANILLSVGPDGLNTPELVGQGQRQQHLNNILHLADQLDKAAEDAENEGHDNLAAAMRLKAADLRALHNRHLRTP